MKFANTSFSTYTNGILAGTLGSSADNQITLDQGQTAVFHLIEGSSFMTNSFGLYFNGSAGSGGGGMSRTDYLTGHYWRTGSIGGGGNPGNHLLGASVAFTEPSPFVFTGQSFTSTSFTTGAPLGTGTGTQVTIQVY